MGGSSSDSGGSSNLDSLRSRDKAMAEQANRQKEQQEARSREDSFNSYQEQRKAASKGIDVMISPQKAKTVRENAGLAMDLDAKAKKSQINIPIPTLGSVAMNTISSINYRNQASQLRDGGKPIYSDDGSYQGVMNNGRYSGNTDYDPNRSQTDDSDSSTQTTSSAPPKDVTEPIKKKTPTLSSASRRAMLSGSGGGASRRNLL